MAAILGPGGPSMAEDHLRRDSTRLYSIRARCNKEWFHGERPTMLSAKNGCDG